LDDGDVKFDQLLSAEGGLSSTGIAYLDQAYHEVTENFGY
jgi:hypothetical protein